MLGADDRSLPAAQAVIELAFAAERMGLGEAGPEARDLAIPGLGDLGFLRERIRAGLTAMAVAESVQDGPLAAGSHQLAGGVCEVTGVGTLPPRAAAASAPPSPGGWCRTRASAAPRSCSSPPPATDVARMYEGLGFRRVGTACFGFPGDA